MPVRPSAGGGLLGAGSPRTILSTRPRNFEYLRPDLPQRMRAGTRYARRLALGRVNNTAAREAWLKVQDEDAATESAFFPTSVMQYQVRTAACVPPPPTGPPPKSVFCYS